MSEFGDFSIVLAIRRRIPGTRLAIEELLVQAWHKGKAANLACRLSLPPGVCLSDEEWEGSPFCCREPSSASELRRALCGQVVCWPGLEPALDLLSRLAQWLPDSRSSAWDFQDLWRTAFPSRRPQKVDLQSVAAFAGASIREPEKSTRIAEILGLAVCRLHSGAALQGLRQAMEDEGDLDCSRRDWAAALLDQVPESPGIYWMQDRTGSVFYVGKSRNLRRRLRSYFVPARFWDAKLHRIHLLLDRVEFQPVGNELQALLEEARAIARWQPLINIQMEIRERQPGYYKEANWILVLPDGGRSIRLYFIRDGRYCGDFRYSGRRPQREKLEVELRRIFFSDFVPEERWETHVIQSFLRQKGEQANHIDVGQAQNAAQCVLWIERYRQDGLEEPTVFRT